MGRLHTTAEHRREKPGELHDLPILQRRARSLARSTHALVWLVQRRKPEKGKAETAEYRRGRALTVLPPSACFPLPEASAAAASRLRAREKGWSPAARPPPAAAAE